MLWLLLYVVAVSLIDLRTRYVPNWATLPIFLAGLLARFPGNPELWLASSLLVLAWAKHWMGGGDVKLWLAVLWALPTPYSAFSLPLMFAAFFLTGLLQMGGRIIMGRPPTGSPTPAAWRTVPFVLACWYVH